MNARTTGGRAAPAATTGSPPPTYRPLSITSGVRASAARAPSKLALREGKRRLTYAALVDRIDRVSQAAVTDLGLRRGDTCALVAPNCLEYFEIVGGLSEAGVAVATLNPRQTPAEIEFIVGDCGARAVFIHPAVEAMVRSATLPSVERTLALGPEYDGWLARARPRRPAAVPNEWEPFALCYTSGTTGRPKGVVLSHRSRVLTFFAMAVEYGCYGPDDRYLALAPLYHGAGFAFALATLYFGGYCEILPAFDPERVVRTLSEERLGGTFMVPTHFHAIFGLAPATLDRYRRFALKAIVSNAAPLPQATKERIVDYFGPGILHETYGSTEAGIVTNLRPADQLRKVQCVGQPFPCNLVRLLDDDGQDVPRGEVGELYSDSPYLFNGYWGRPADTTAAMRDGWFSAGDLARMDEEGFVYLVDRKHDLIITGGVNVYPREIEEALFRHTAIRDAAVVGTPDDYWGEAIQAFVVAAPGSALGATEVIEHCRRHLAPHKLPKQVRFVEALPRNAAGKVLKRELRAR